VGFSRPNLCESVLTGERSFLSPAKAGSPFERHAPPTGEPVGYGSYAGFADGRILGYDTIITGCATAISVLNALNARTVY
jgi:hypothetical protein